MKRAAEKPEHKPPGETVGELVLRRTADGGFPGIGIYLGDSTALDELAHSALKEGIQIRLINVTERTHGQPVAHIGICAPRCLVIEREENITHPRLRFESGVSLPQRFRTLPGTRKAGPLKDWIDDAQLQITELENTVRELKEESRKARAAGWHHRSNNGYLKYCMLQRAIVSAKSKSTMLREKRNIAIARLKEANKMRSLQGTEDYHRRFYESAHRILNKDQLTKVTSAMNAGGSSDGNICRTADSLKKRTR